MEGGGRRRAGKRRVGEKSLNGVGPAVEVWARAKGPEEEEAEKLEGRAGYASRSWRDLR